MTRWTIGAALAVALIAAGLLSVPRAAAQDTFLPLSGTVSLDDDNDGVADGPQPGVRVEVWLVDDESVVAASVTAADGRWQTSLPPGEYYLRIAVPDNMIVQAPAAQPDPLAFSRSGTTRPFTLADGGQTQFEATLAPDARIEISAWLDNNGNQVLDADEPVFDFPATISGAVVWITNIETGEQSSTSDIAAVFDRLPLGAYRVELAIDGLLELVDSPDSDIDQATQQATVTVTSLQPAPTVTVGFSPVGESDPFTTVNIINANEGDVVVPQTGLPRSPVLSHPESGRIVSLPAPGEAILGVAGAGQFEFVITLAPGEEPETLRCGEAEAFTVRSEFDDSAFVYRTIITGSAVGQQALYCSMTTRQSVFGDVNCDGALSILDAAIVAAYVVRTRTEHQPCPTTPGASQVNLTAIDTNDDGVANILDAFRIAECAVRLINSLCPEPVPNPDRFLRNTEYPDIALQLSDIIFDEDQGQRFRSNTLCEAIQPVLQSHPAVIDWNRAPFRIEFYAGDGPRLLGAEVLVGFAAGLELLGVMGIDDTGASFGYEPYPEPPRISPTRGVLSAQDYKDARIDAIGAAIIAPGDTCALLTPP